MTACHSSNQPALGLSPAGLEQAPLVIRSANGEHRFTVEIARTAQQQEYGLMNRQTMAADHGMIFPYSPPQQVNFWMKNTLIPLDMLFIKGDGTIADIRTAAPLSLDPVGPGSTPIGAVLELNGGTAAQLGIKPGDTVKWPG
ncbi:DUF192 domain-containing protein [Sphingomonas ginkgonis]|uniref:DUF192 domain-containing protein n=1 Tax=Sphingomonas ginkgonis TaxID=2315330 RepID=A0A429V8R9_9SPHN|nr:DUF192 domain-containing protein [Sphingomonas ginkgonis]RST30272.1 DUF192 domain-containing protein [Sphingomonas ginkgonis]